jgi:hypothetical protein
MLATDCRGKPRLPPNLGGQHCCTSPISRSALKASPRSVRPAQLCSDLNCCLVALSGGVLVLCRRTRSVASMTTVLTRSKRQWAHLEIEWKPWERADEAEDLGISQIGILSSGLNVSRPWRQETSALHCIQPNQGQMDSWKHTQEDVVAM